MSSTKRWQTIYAEANPFGVVQGLRKGLKEVAKDAGQPLSETVRHLWIYLGQDGRQHCECGSNRALTPDEWLNVIDEAAAMGARTAIISVAEPPAKRPELWDIIQWAQQTHQMIVGIHLYGSATLEERDVERLAAMNPDLTRLFVDGVRLHTYKEIEARGIPVLSANGRAHGEPQPKCHLPQDMTCVDGTGEAYTCGLVLGKDEFLYGNIFARRLDHIMNDERLPHHIPENTPAANASRCDGCPPLMLRRMNGE